MTANGQVQLQPRPPEQALYYWEGDRICFAWPGMQMIATLDHFVDDRNDCTAEVTYYEMRDEKPAHLLGPVRINLLSDIVAGRVSGQVAKMSFASKEEISARQQELRWMTVQIQTLGIMEHRKEPPITNLAEVEVTAGPPPHLLAPLLPERAPTVIVANGGGGKSYLALSIGVALVTGRSLPGLDGPSPAARKVIYLDWEANADEHARRLRQVATGMGLPTLPPIQYWQVSETLVRSSWLRAALAREAPDLVIVDSISYAMGGDIKEAGACTAMFREVGAWNRSTLLIHHENRDGGFYGTAFIRNCARSFWLMDSLSSGPDVRLSLTHDKYNNGPLHPEPITLRLHFDQGGRRASWHPHDLDNDTMLLDRMPPGQRVETLLRRTIDGRMLAEDLETALDLSTYKLKKAVASRAGILTWIGGHKGRGSKSFVAFHRPPPGEED